MAARREPERKLVRPESGEKRERDKETFSSCKVVLVASSAFLSLERVVMCSSLKRCERLKLSCLREVVVGDQR